MWSDASATLNADGKSENSGGSKTKVAKPEAQRTKQTLLTEQQQINKKTVCNVSPWQKWQQALSAKRLAPALPAYYIKTQPQSAQKLPALVNHAACAHVSYLHFFLPLFCWLRQKTPIFHIQ